MKARISALLALAAILGIGTAAQAKPLSRIIAEMGLSPADFEVVSATADGILASGTPKVGAEQGWSSEASGSKGTIRIQDVRDNCVILQHVVQPGGSEQTREVRTQRCKDASGKWVLTP